ncbi:MAG TPA: N-methylproline demethylase, partial [Beijerinckiaceae bacterium]|nr:N-methylproline demethylase [Beijerinckiaceae bacterium]
GKAGGQLLLATRNPRRRELIGIVDWRLSELARLGVVPRYNHYVHPADVDALQPEAVIVATGGLPQAPALEAGQELAISSWDILSGSAKIAETVLLYDDNGAHPGMSAAELIARAGARLEIVTPERMLAPDMGPFNHVPYMQAFRRQGAQLTIATRLKSVRRDGNKLVATLSSDYAPDVIEERRVDQVVVEHGTLPAEDLYTALLPRSRNGGEIDYAALVAHRMPFPMRRPEGRFVLLRIGDAVQSRNVHAAIYDGLRYGLLL